MQIGLNDKAYVVALITLSILLLTCNSLIFASGFVAKCLVLIYFAILISFCIFTYKEIKHSFLINIQLFYIIPFLISFVLAKKLHFPEYLLYFIAFTLANLICFYELIDKKATLKSLTKFSNENIIYFGISLLLITAIVALCLFFPPTGKFMLLLSILSIYMIVAEVPNITSKFPELDSNNNYKILLYGSAIAAVYFFVLFKETPNLLVYFIYIIAATNLCFCFRTDKWYFFLTVILLATASLFPLHINAHYVDSLLVAAIVLLFHIKSPVLYFKDTEYGLLKVVYDYKDNKLSLLNDNIYQGEKNLDHTSYQNTLYYGHIENGPVATIFDLSRQKKATSHIAILGLGTGAMAAFGKASQNITFYEINPEVVKIAKSEKFFNYLANSAAKINIVMGDARKKLVEAKDHHYDLICMDVYLGRDIPQHFLTLEAIKLYLQKLNKKGIALLHLTNKDRDLESLIAQIVQNLGVYACTYYQSSLTEELAKKQGMGVITNKNYKDKLKEKILKLLGRLINLDLSYLITEDKEEIYPWVAVSQDQDTIKSLTTFKKWHKLSVSDEKQIVYTDKAIDYNHDGGEIIVREIE